MATLLLVDDELTVLEMLAACCQDAGHQVLSAGDGREALRTFFQHHPDLVIADVRMPVMNGLELISRIREVSEVPIIVLSALGEEKDKIQGLRLGADDYLVKPVGMDELVARVGAALRRAQLPPVGGIKEVYSDAILTIHLDRQEVYLKDKKVNLTLKELRLLAYLTQRAGRVVSVPELLRGVWGSLHYSEESVKWHIASLRRKIEEDPHRPKLIITIWGSGYRYDKPSPLSMSGGLAI